jgi:hypothetical protein
MVSGCQSSPRTASTASTCETLRARKIRILWSGFLQFSGVVETHVVFLVLTAKLELSAVQDTDPTSVKGNLLNYGVVGTFVLGLQSEQLP